MALGSDAFSVSMFIWAELSDSMDDARNDLSYAPCVMYIIERVSGIEFKKDVEHRPHKLTQWQHIGWEALVGQQACQLQQRLDPLIELVATGLLPPIIGPGGASSRSCSRTYFVCVSLLWMLPMREEWT